MSIKDGNSKVWVNLKNMYLVEDITVTTRIQNEIKCFLEHTLATIHAIIMVIPKINWLWADIGAITTKVTIGADTKSKKAVSKNFFIDFIFN